MQILRSKRIEICLACQKNLFKWLIKKKVGDLSEYKIINFKRELFEFSFVGILVENTLGLKY